MGVYEPVYDFQPIVNSTHPWKGKTKKASGCPSILQGVRKFLGRWFNLFLANYKVKNA